MADTSYRILYDGEQWFGSNAGSCARALRRLGHSVMALQINDSIPNWQGRGLKLLRRALRPRLVREHNRLLLAAARIFQPHLFLVFKGAHLYPATLSQLRDQGVALYNYYPDVSAFTHTYSYLPSALQLYDCVFSTKTFFANDLARRGYPLRRFEWLPHGYDPEAHRPLSLSEAEISFYGADVAFVGAFGPGKEQILAGLRKLLPNLNLVIWGDAWSKAASPELTGCIRGRGVYGDEYTRAVCASHILLGLLSVRQSGSSLGDQVTSRSFNIPACGAFLLHQRNPEILQFYQEGREIECFDSVPELAEKIRYYLAHPEKRQAVAQAGYRRCVPAYAHDQRMQTIIQWHQAQGC